MTYVPTQYTIGREIAAFNEAMRWARLVMCRDSRDDVYAWKTVGAAGQPGFGSGWTNYDPNTYHPVQFMKHPLDGLIYMRGAAQANPWSPNPVFTLPAKYRPAQVLALGAYIYTDFLTWATTTMLINPDGTVVQNLPVQQGNVIQLSLDGVFFPYKEP
jgi:hypothetical protein